jgi:four helix bundle protein
MSHFRFQDLEIWQDALAVGIELCCLAEENLEPRKLYRYAEQLRGAALSISNNIAEGSGSTSKKEFQQFLNYAKRSVFENANMLHFFAARSFLSPDKILPLLERLGYLSARITRFSRSLNK